MRSGSQLIVMGWIVITIGILFIIGGILYLMFAYEKDTGGTVERAQQLSQSKYDPNMTRFAAGKEAKASEVRGALLTNVNYEISQLTATIEQEAAALKAGYGKDHAFSDYSIKREKHLADHEAYLALADNKTTVARIASQMGLDSETMRELILEKARMETQLAFKMQEMQLEVEKARQLKQLDFEFEHKMAMLDRDMAEIKHLLPEHLIGALNKQLSQVHFEYEQVKLFDDGDYKDRELKRVEQNIKILEKSIRERRKNI